MISSRKFTKERIEEIKEIFLEWTKKIENIENFHFVKFGDGEFFCMMGVQGKNCDNHPYSKELGDKLYESWYFFNKLDNVWVAEWAGHKQDMNFNSPSEIFQKELLEKTNTNVKFVHYEILLQNILLPEKLDFFKSIKESKRKKIFVGPKRLKGVVNFLNVDYIIEVPLVNSFSLYGEILKKILKEIEKDCIILTCVGMPAKSLIHKAIEYNKNITCLDVGSGFDSIFVGQTREGQLNINVVRKFYEELL